ncbi:hypothetical protein EYZ11_013125 [Aspergillus tanneri]|uniref:Uncharacterized protein n=1 Tax=Aspergillus tanneri TaxID=1220188 RepID=A0A4S3J3W4_9EURO|nr:hypothetical protein EYZ11_013125 [Aspergillus tanneri]
MELIFAPPPLDAPLPVLLRKLYISFYEAVVNGMEVLEDPPLPNRSTPIPEPLLQLPLTRTKNVACCKDRTICDHFSFFNCSEIDGDNKDNGEKEDTSI